MREIADFTQEAQEQQEIVLKEAYFI